MSFGNRKTIALFLDWVEVSDWHQKLLQGAHRAAEKNNINLLAISAGNLASLPKEDPHSTIFYSLLHSPSIDGAIFLSQSLTYRSSLERLNEIIQFSKSDIPMISIGAELESCRSIFLNFEPGLEDLLHHMFKDHGYKNPCFLAGPKDAEDSQFRLRCFLKIAKEYGIEIAQKQIFEGTFGLLDGEKALEYFLDKQALRPDCIICANDGMALGTYRALRKRGLDIPITGYDDTTISFYCHSPLTTVKQPIEEAGFHGVSWMDKIFKEKNSQTVFNTHTYVTQLVKRSSCGCTYNENVHSAMNHYDDAVETMIRGQNERTMQWVLSSLAKNYHLYRKCSGNEQLEKSLLEMLNIGTLYLSSWKGQFQGVETHSLMQVAWEDGKRMELPEEGLDYSFLELLPPGFGEKKRWTLVVQALFNVSKSIGMLILEYNRNLKNIYETLMNNFSGAIDGMNLSREMYNLNEQLYKTSKKLKEQSLRDELTGLYNRRGFITLSEHQLNLSGRMKDHLWLLYFDMDGLKKINDTWGHNEGDMAIKGFAECLISSFRKTDIISRQGGDEFTLLVKQTHQENISQLHNRLQNEVNRFNQCIGKPWKLSFSMGQVKIDFDKQMSLYQWMQLADKVLYSEKKRKKETLL